MYYLYSHNDLDGVGCGIIAKLAFGEKVEIRYNSISGLDFQIERFLERGSSDNFLFITDLSVNEENEKRLDEYVKNGGKVKLIDHHKTALHFNKYNWGNVQVEYKDGRLTSATSLLYDYFIQHHFIKPSQALEQFVELVRQYDTWEWDRNGNLEAKRLNDLFFMISIDEFEERMVERIKNNNDFGFDDFEEKLLDMEEDKIERYVRRKKREIVQTFINNYCTGIVHAESYHSELGNELGKEYDHLDYIAIINVGGKKVSLRTIHDEIDVSEIANHFGGGGHAKAAGCPLNDEAYQLYVAEPFQVEPIKFDAFKNRYNLKESKHGSLYESRQGDRLYIYPFHEQNWAVECNDSRIGQSFSSFKEAERFIKRNYSAWLVRDESFVGFLMEHVINTKTLNAHLEKEGIQENKSKLPVYYQSLYSNSKQENILNSH